jgi:hypothetical protein
MTTQTIRTHNRSAEHTTNTQPAFAYTDENLRQALEQCAEGILKLTRRSIADNLAIVQYFSRAKEKLEHGKFIPWVEACELPYSQRTIERYISVLNMFKNDKLAARTATAGLGTAWGSRSSHGPAPGAPARQSLA